MSPAPLTDYGTCNECDTPMRSARAFGSNQRGTRPRKRDGLCQNCYQAARRAAAHPDPMLARPGEDPTAAEERRDRENAQAFQAWLTERRRRGVPEQGWNAA